MEVDDFTPDRLPKVRLWLNCRAVTIIHDWRHDILHPEPKGARDGRRDAAIRFLADVRLGSKANFDISIRLQHGFAATR